MIVIIKKGENVNNAGFDDACEILHVEEIYKRKKNLICLIKKGGFYLTEEEIKRKGGKNIIFQLLPL